MAKEQNLFPLKMLVVSLGILLLGGLALLVGAAWSKSGGRCHDVEVDMSNLGQVTGVHAEGQNIILFVKNQNNNNIRIVTLDACTGKEKSMLTIVSK